MGVAEAYGRLSAALVGSVLHDERLSRHTSLRVGGPAALHVTCDAFSDLRVATEVLREEGVPWVVLGRGTCVVAGDAGYPGAVLTLGGEFRRFSVDADGRMHVGAGTALQRVVTEAFKEGLSGLEFAAGVPGSVGGAVSMNVASPGTWFGMVVDEVVTFRPGEGLVRRSGSEICWYRRCCDLPHREIVVEAVLGLARGDAARVKLATEEVLAGRKASQPLDARACGGLFADLDDRTASAAIGSCGLAGHVRGGAQICPKNPNYVLNAGGASSADVAEAIADVLEGVRRADGIELRPEVKFLGFAS